MYTSPTVFVNNKSNFPIVVFKDRFYLTANGEVFSFPYLPASKISWTKVTDQNSYDQSRYNVIMNHLRSILIDEVLVSC